MHQSPTDQFLQWTLVFDTCYHPLPGYSALHEMFTTISITLQLVALIYSSSKIVNRDLHLEGFILAILWFHLQCIRCAKFIPVEKLNSGLVTLARKTLIRSHDSPFVLFCNLSLSLLLDTAHKFFQPGGSSSSVDMEEIYFDFRKQRYIFSDEKENFCKLPYPTKETMGYYLKSTGHGSEAKVVAATEKWGRNLWVTFFLLKTLLLNLWLLPLHWQIVSFVSPEFRDSSLNGIFLMVLASS